ncbi:transcriptional regulator [Amycolatopsis antarctica]|uniref:Transcriptional regulator n=1 Tax=Amycolatopsis antarctica TaxID=1854586 RepID=A0A263CZI3_9PSEU|nr:transcriptional regulator [Amycolatopsis antarctica]OZM71584.1 transcriptional regulator [Amycolatopsis antarctica]
MDGCERDTGAAELNRLLETGPFAEALRVAIRERGLGLDRIRERLAKDGAAVSPATLSYWQSGRSRPERRSSLATLARLETLLGVPAGALAALLPPPRRRGRWASGPAGAVELCAHWPQADRVADAVSGVDTRWDERLTRLSQHDRVIVGAGRAERSFVSRQVLRAEADGPDRWVVIMHIDEHDRPVPVVRALHNCRLGRVVARPEDGLLVAELLFPRPLRAGDTVITEHELANIAPFPLATGYERKFRLPVREYVLEVVFDGVRPPAHCESYSRRDSESEKTVNVPVAENGSVHSVALGFGPGVYGFRWEWDGATAPGVTSR